MAIIMMLRASVKENVDVEIFIPTGKLGAFSFYLWSKYFH